MLLLVDIWVLGVSFGGVMISEIRGSGHGYPLPFLHVGALKTCGFEGVRVQRFGLFSVGF